MTATLFEEPCWTRRLLVILAAPLRSIEAILSVLIVLRGCWKCPDNSRSTSKAPSSFNLLIEDRIDIEIRNQKREISYIPIHLKRNIRINISNRSQSNIDPWLENKISIKYQVYNKITSPTDELNHTRNSIPNRQRESFDTRTSNEALPLSFHRCSPLSNELARKKRREISAEEASGITVIAGKKFAGH